MQKQKMYCYVDESGQDTGGEIFIVAIVIVESERDKIRAILKEIEIASGKKERKWTRATPAQRAKYLEYIFAKDMPNMIGCYCAQHSHTKDYQDFTVAATAAAIQRACEGFPYIATVFVDGLRRTERNKFGSHLRKRGIRTSKVRGIRDQSDELIRLADAIAGFVRDALQNDAATREQYEYAIRNGKIIMVQ